MNKTQRCTQLSKKNNIYAQLKTFLYILLKPVLIKLKLKLKKIFCAEFLTYLNV